MRKFIVTIDGKNYEVGVEAFGKYGSCIAGSRSLSGNRGSCKRRKIAFSFSRPDQKISCQ